MTNDPNLKAQAESDAAATDAEFHQDGGCSDRLLDASPLELHRTMTVPKLIRPDHLI